jgi:hypothetical protein
MRSKSGGGITSKNVKQVGYRTGKGSRAATPGGVGQLGEMVGDHVTEGRHSSGYRGEPLFKGPAYNKGGPFGNELVAATVCKPGGSREVSRTGSQGCHGPVNPGSSPARKDQLSDFGPDYQRKGRFG